MNPVHLHLVVNHLPVIGMPIALLVTAWGALRRESGVERTGLLLLVALALTAPVAYLTGEPAEDALYGIDGVSGPALEEHEESAEYALVLTLAAGAAALVALVLARRRGSPPVVLRIAALALALLSIVVLARTANLGGHVHHPELRKGSSLGMSRSSARGQVLA